MKMGKTLKIFVYELVKVRDNVRANVGVFVKKNWALVVSIVVLIVLLSAISSFLTGGWQFVLGAFVGVITFLSVSYLKPWWVEKKSK